MQGIQIRRAERKKSKLRVGMSGPSGSGKTYSALLVARGLASSWDKIALIDSESGRGELYSDLGEYNIITLEAPFTPERYIEAIRAAEEAGMEVIVVDSTSHEWDGPGGCLEINEKLAAAKFKGNTWAAWSETTPRHRRFIDSIVASKAHIITTARSKTDTIQTEDKKIKKVGLKEIQREGFEYELTVNFNLDRDGHNAIASKDNTHLFDARDPFVISIETGKELKAWSESGADIPVDVMGEKRKIMHNLTRLGFTLAGTPAEQGAKIAAVVMALTEMEVSDVPSLPEIVRKLEGFKDIEGAQAIYGVYASTHAPEAIDQPAPEEPAVQMGESVSPPAASHVARIPGTTVEYPQPDEINPEDIPF
jgi:hypothetical protein